MAQARGRLRAEDRVQVLELDGCPGEEQLMRQAAVVEIVFQVVLDAEADHLPGLAAGRVDDAVTGLAPRAMIFAAPA